MRKILFCLSSVIFVVTAQAQETHNHDHSVEAKKNTPVTQVVAAPVTEDFLGMSETQYDFGKIPQGKPVTHIFEVVNLGKDSLHISNVQASCGCTTPEWKRGEVQAPGEKTYITVGYNAASEGQFTKSITISYNSNHSKQITIKGEVWKTPVSSAPENKELKNLKDDLQ